jgi:hypothetical protein
MSPTTKSTDTQPPGCGSLSTPDASSPAPSTSDQSSISGPATALSACTSSPASADGPTRSISLGGQQLSLFGPDPAPASLSALPGSGVERPTSGTCGQCGGNSSASADLQRCLESRLRAAVEGLGSPVYALTWKRWDMQSGPPICALRASARRTSGSGCTGWPTCAARDWKSGCASDETMERNARPLSEVAGLAGWPTPCQQDGPKGGPGQGEDRLPGAAALAGWSTPTRQDSASSGVADYPQTDTHHTGQTLTDQARLSGPPATGSPAGTDGCGRLNPNHSRWLMGFHRAWTWLGVLAFRKSKRR